MEDGAKHAGCDKDHTLYIPSRKAEWASINDPIGFLSNWIVVNSSSTTICHWYGITCRHNSSGVNAVHLSGKNITSKSNTSVSISSIFQLPHVEHIDLSDNQLSVGWEITNFTSPSPLRYLNLSNNNFTGSLPRGLFTASFSLIQTLDLSNNMFSGEIPHQIGKHFSSLTYLDLGGNVLVGNIPDSITNMTRLQYLTLASNQLWGEIPQQIGLMKSLKWIYLGYNNLSGEIPQGIGELISLNHLDLVYNNLTGQIPRSFGNLTNLENLFLYQNKLTGLIPPSVFELKKLVSLDLSDNFLRGDIPELVIQLQRLEILHLFSNNFTGRIPNALTSLPRLQVLQLWSNGFTGKLPGDLGKRNNLTVLDLSSNNLSGVIPDSLCHSGNLYKLILFSNSLEGPIPNSLTSCLSLRRVRLQNNKLSGELPTQLTQLSQIYFLDISSNRLSGRIDDRKWDMLALQLLNLGSNNFSGELPVSFGSKNLEKLDLSGNRFSGYIPRGVGRLAELMELKLSNNELHGDIPEEITLCKKLVVLNVSHNDLSGKIPTSLGDMPVLSLLDLSQNQLSGEIPENLGKVESLVQVNISHNHFHGQLPATGAFLAINGSAVTGNDLCGDTWSGLPPCKKSSKNGRRWRVVVLWFVMMGVVGFGLGGCMIVYVGRRIRKKLEVKRVESKDGRWEMEFLDSKAAKLISMEEVIWSAKEGKVISKEKRRGWYEGKWNMNEVMQMEVKEMREVNWGALVELGKVEHSNVVKLMGMCRCGKGGYLVYEYVEGKRLRQVLSDMNWERRRRIAVGIAKALNYVHAHCSASVLVAEMSAERVLIDANDVPRLKLSPEARSGKEKSSEIYGMGVILMEILTGRNPEMEEEEGIVEWARQRQEQKEMVETMSVALQCTASDPAARPCATRVFKTLSALSSTTTLSSCLFPLNP
ncbi:putative inactive leucine-rich repeat receptor-like protein kinase [Senna tora]|uniref:Putative inactive leucine-rich repeat receptor-like protein kinase n=1 Tax=Senna tora TaxID=362788 RepID=A0A834TX24_9FABA|nr:putative inactive leucine-rich repeat receptor-like protein kinase [Senna tora]